MGRKSVTITLRLDPGQEKRLEQAVRLRRVSRSEAVRRAVDEFCERALKEEGLTPYERLIRWIPPAKGTGVRHLSQNSGEKYRRSLWEKYRGRHAH